MEKNLTGEQDWTYAQRETEVNRIAKVIVDAGCKPYAAAEALIAAGVRLPSARGGA